MPYTGSKAFSGQGTILSYGDGASLEAFSPIAELKNIQFTGAKADAADVTNMDSVGAYREWMPTLLDGGEVSLSGNYVPSDTSQQALQTIFDARSILSWRITLPPSSIATAGYTTPGYWAFNGFLNSPTLPDLSHDKEATFNAKIKITGKPVFVPEAA